MSTGTANDMMIHFNVAEQEIKVHRIMRHIILYMQYIIYDILYTAYYMPHYAMNFDFLFSHIRMYHHVIRSTGTHGECLHYNVAQP